MSQRVPENYKPCVIMAEDPCVAVPRILHAWHIVNNTRRVYYTLRETWYMQTLN